MLVTSLGRRNHTLSRFSSHQEGEGCLLIVPHSTLHLVLLVCLISGKMEKGASSLGDMGKGRRRGIRRVELPSQGREQHLLLVLIACFNNLR